jgi:hypothetical protein
MTIDDLLSRLEGVRRTGRGWKAQCPAHSDNDPSLSVREGDKGILLKCWAGCSYAEVLAAIGEEPEAGFYDEGERKEGNPQKAPKRRSDWRTFSDALYFRAMDIRLSSEKVLDAARGSDISTWTDADLDAAWKVVGQAYRNLERADQLDRLDCALRVYGLGKESRREHGC